MKQVTIYTTGTDHNIQVDEKIVTELVNLVPQTENQVYTVKVSDDANLHINVAHITAISEANIVELVDSGTDTTSDI